MDNENKSIVYEDAIAELESIVNKLQSGQVSLDDSLALYTRGVELAAICDEKIKEVEQKIAVVNTATEEEQPMDADSKEGF